MLSNYFLRNAQACWRVSGQHLYHSRAHPKPTPEFAITDALSSLLKDVNGRKRSRTHRLKRRGLESSDTQHPDETIELAVNLNLDPRKPGQALRGSISLPNGTGKKQMDCMVFTANPVLQEAALKAGAKYAGGESLADEIVAGKIAVDSIQRSLATADIMPVLSKKVARLLGPRGLMPNAKEGTLLQGDSDLLEALETQLAGKQVPYRTEKEGIVHIPVGKGSFEKGKLLENIGAVMKTIFDVKPDNYGKGKQKKAVGKGTKYLLRASVSSTQGKGVRLDLRTVDPNNVFFLSSPEEVAKAVAATSDSSPEVA